MSFCNKNWMTIIWVRQHFWCVQEAFHSDHSCSFPSYFCKIVFFLLIVLLMIAFPNRITNLLQTTNTMPTGRTITFIHLHNWMMRIKIWIWRMTKGIKTNSCLSLVYSLNCFQMMKNHQMITISFKYRQWVICYVSMTLTDARHLFHDSHAAKWKHFCFCFRLVLASASEKHLSSPDRKLTIAFWSSLLWNKFLAVVPNIRSGHFPFFDSIYPHQERQKKETQTLLLEPLFPSQTPGHNTPKNSSNRHWF